MWYSVTGIAAPIGAIYDGDRAMGDRAATTLEVSAAQAFRPPPLSDGLQIISTGTPALNGTYSVNTQILMAEVVYVSLSIAQGTPEFSNGLTTKGWPDISGAIHVFTIAQFVEFAKAIARYVDALLAETYAAQLGATPNWPAQSVTIS